MPVPAAAKPRAPNGTSFLLGHQIVPNGLPVGPLLQIAFTV
jgi:hypothetical protein